MAKPEAPSDRTRIRRLPELAAYDLETLYAIIDASPIAHLGVTDEEGIPVVLPQLCARQENRLLLHGSRSNRILKRAVAAERVCLAFTLVDGLVLARSGFNSTYQYRSATCFGSAQEITDDDERFLALCVLSDRAIPGRRAELREPLARELALTLVIAVDIEEASSKVSSGGPDDDPADIASETWAGVIPIEARYGFALAAADGEPGRVIPASVSQLEGKIWR